jgi:glutamate racemase
LCQQYTRAIGQFGTENGQLDALVLGCTHYPFARQHLLALLGPDIALLDNGEPVARQTRRILSTLAPPDAPGHCTLLSTAGSSTLQRAARHWLGLDGPVESLMGV